MRRYNKIGCLIIPIIKERDGYERLCPPFTCFHTEVDFALCRETMKKWLDAGGEDASKVNRKAIARLVKEYYPNHIVLDLEIDIDFRSLFVDIKSSRINFNNDG